MLLFSFQTTALAHASSCKSSTWSVTSLTQAYRQLHVPLGSHIDTWQWLAGCAVNGEVSGKYSVAQSGKVGWLRLVRMWPVLLCQWHCHAASVALLSDSVTAGMAFPALLRPQQEDPLGN